MLKVILIRLKTKAEEIIAEEHAGFRAGRSTTELIFNLRILCEKYLQHQWNLYHVFIDFNDVLLMYLMHLLVVDHAPVGLCVVGHAPAGCWVVHHVLVGWHGGTKYYRNSDIGLVL